MFPLIISYYTKTWDYEKHAERLRKECNNLGLKHEIKLIESSGSWISNTRLKPKFIKDCMDEYDSPLLWIDVDGSIYKTPDFLKDCQYDFVGRHQRTGPMRTWHVGTMFFNNTEGGKRILNAWNEQCTIGTGTDEAAFEEAWKSVNDVSYKELPDTYFLILDGTTERKHDTVIAHRLSKCPSKMEMKSRKLKNS